MEQVENELNEIKDKKDLDLNKKYRTNSDKHFFDSMKNIEIEKEKNIKKEEKKNSINNNINKDNKDITNLTTLNNSKEKDQIEKNNENIIKKLKKENAQLR